METTHAKIPLPIFLKLLSSNGLPLKKAMEIMGKVSVEPVLPLIHAFDDLDSVTRSATPVRHWHN